jgi:hypothetical protein
MNLSYVVTGEGSIGLTWENNVINCVEIDYYNIYVNGSFYTTSTVLSKSISGLTVCDTYTFYVTSVSLSGLESDPSASLTFQLLWPGPPTNVHIVNYDPTSGSLQATLGWDEPNTYICSIPYITYNIYLDSIEIASNVTSLSYLITGLEFYTQYVFGVQSSMVIDGNTFTSSIVTITYTTSYPFAAPGATVTYSSGTFTIIYTTVGSSTLTLYPAFPDLDVLVIGGGGGGAGTPVNPPSPTTTYQLWGSGGGGGGQAILYYKNTTVNQTYSLTVGSGGTGSNTGNGADGTKSSFATYTSGGGKGGNYGGNFEPFPATPSLIYGNDGGSGGSYPSIGGNCFASGSGGNGGRGGEWPQPLPSGGSWPFPTYYYAGNGQDSFTNINKSLSLNPSIPSFGGGGGGAASQGGKGGDGTGGIPDNSGITTCDGISPGAGGGGYNINYLGSGANQAGNGSNGFVGVTLKWPIVNSSLFSFDGVYITSYANSYYYTIFSTGGTLTLNQDIYDCYIVCVGGGGGGGGGTPGGTAEIVGSGGSGGGAAVMNVSSLNSGSYTITVGIGGTGGATSSTPVGAQQSGGAGTTSSFTNYSSSLYITTTGGGGGTVYIGSYSTDTGTAYSNAQGTVTSNSDLIVSTGTGNGGTGGYGIYGINYFAQSGVDSDIYNSGSGYTMPTGNTIIFSGGGGGSKDGPSSYGSCGNAGQGYGGAFGWSQQVSWPQQQEGLSSLAQYPLFGQLEEQGQDAKIYGGGGGGASGRHRGGNGGPGLVILCFKLSANFLTHVAYLGA